MIAGRIAGLLRMNIIHADAYRTAFGAYLRHGTDIRRSLKQAATADRYVWRTRRDEDVRPEHRRRDGRIFSWTDNPPPLHPGDDHNCRCEAVPYVPGETEFGFHDFSTGLASSYDRWGDGAFMAHYFRGGGRPVDLLEIGHLREIAEQHAYGDGPQGAFRRLTDQLADAARAAGDGPLRYEFGATYDFGDVAFSHGDGVVRGTFTGTVRESGEMLVISGETRFEFSDRFADPLDIGVEPGGTPYDITGNWSATFSAEILKDAARSVSGGEGGR